MPKPIIPQPDRQKTPPSLVNRAPMTKEATGWKERVTKVKSDVGGAAGKQLSNNLRKLPNEPPSMLPKFSCQSRGWKPPVTLANSGPSALRGSSLRGGTFTTSDPFAAVVPVPQTQQPSPMEESRYLYTKAGESYLSDNIYGVIPGRSQICKSQKSELKFKIQAAERALLTEKRLPVALEVMSHHPVADSRGGSGRCFQFFCFASCAWQWPWRSCLTNLLPIPGSRRLPEALEVMSHQPVGNSKGGSGILFQFF
eukprot:gene12033-15134_t